MFRVYVAEFMNIDPKCRSYLVYEPDFHGLNLIIHNGKLKIHSPIQHLLKLADLQSMNGACLDKC